MTNPYVPLLFLAAIGAGFAVLSVATGAILGPKRYNRAKVDAYECGIEPQTDARDRYSIRYYIIAMLFVVFDVETVFMFPWAVIMHQLKLFGLVEMIVFLFILIVGYVYAWKQGALEWA